MIKTYLVPVTDEVIKAMEKGESPSFLHCATCLDNLTNGEVAKKVFGLKSKDMSLKFRTPTWWNAKWGE